MADGRQRPQEKRHGPWIRIYKSTDSLLASHCKQGNTYAVGLFNISTIHIIIVLPLALLLRDSYEAGRLYIDLSGFFPLFGAPWEWLAVAVILCLEFILSFSVYFSFLGWAACYRRLGKTVNIPFLLLLAVCVVVSQYFVLSSAFDLHLHPAGRITLSVQQLVFCMKWISFTVENGYKVLYPWHKDDETGPAVWYAGQMDPQIGSFSSYLYFLFCPVLLYRDRYPRKPPNYKKASAYFLQFLSTTLVGYVIFKDYLFPQSFHLNDLITSFLRCIFTGFIQLALSHTCIIHGWMNAWAELLGFADQEFYQDWWNSHNLQEYLCKWNPVIQEWLKAYVFTPLKKWIPPVLAIVAVLFLSAIEHDILISIGIGFFVPVLLITYGFWGAILVSLKPSMDPWIDQMIMSFMLSVGSGIQMYIYVTELAARIHCPSENDSWFDMQTIDCYRKFNQ